MEGLIHIYHGYGKGKTTAAVGLTVRCIGYGKKAVFAQFLKGSDSGEVKVLKSLGATVLRNSKDYGFFPFVSEKEQQEITTENNEILKQCLALSSEADVMVLDEVLDAYNIGALSKNLLDTFIEQKPKSLELILTGRNPTNFHRKKADYITLFEKQKHPFDLGIGAREGIEY